MMRSFLRSDTLPSCWLEEVSYHIETGPVERVTWQRTVDGPKPTRK